MNIPKNYKGTVYFHLYVKGCLAGDITTNKHESFSLDTVLLGSTEVDVDFDVTEQDLTEGTVAALRNENIDHVAKVKENNDKIGALLYITPIEEQE